MIFYNNSKVTFNFILSPSESQVTLLLITVTLKPWAQKEKEKIYP